VNATALRERFPLLGRPQDGRRLVYLDSAATSQKPDVVLEAIQRYYVEDNANVYRGVYRLAARATEAYEAARTKVAAFIGARPEEVVFTRGTTEALNLVAHGYARRHLRPGDEVVVTEAEHHSNLVPWQEVAKETGARLRFLPLDEEGFASREGLLSVLGERTRILALAHVSNVLATVQPIRQLADAAHAAGAVVVVDGAQSVPHMPVSVEELGADFLAFSGHKMCGPTGVGVLFGRYELLEATHPLFFGGEMIEHVDLLTSDYKEPPHKFEGGTPPIAEVVALGAAVDFLASVGMEEVDRHDRALAEEAARRLREIPGVDVYGPKGERAGLVTFNLRGVHPHDVATALDQYAVCVRAGHHCAQPLMRRLGVAASVRASFYLYNDEEDVDRLIEAVAAAKEFFPHVAL
jgi:cysteine desulfurase/selenocysteine lyase